MKKCCSFSLFIHQSVLKKKKNVKQQKLFPTLIINQHIKIISEGSSEKFGVMMLKIQLCVKGINYILSIQIENHYFKLQKYFKISQVFFLYF